MIQFELMIVYGSRLEFKFISHVSGIDRCKVGKLVQQTKLKITIKTLLTYCDSVSKSLERRCQLLTVFHFPPQRCRTWSNFSANSGSGVLARVVGDLIVKRLLLFYGPEGWRE